MNAATIFLARLIGIFSLVVVAGLLVRGGAVIEAVLADRQVMLIIAIISLGLGIAAILSHNIWSGGFLSVVVTLVGWWTFAKSLVLLFLSPDVISALLKQMHYHEYNTVYLVPAFVIGVYLTWSGFAASQSDKG